MNAPELYTYKWLNGIFNKYFNYNSNTIGKAEFGPLPISRCPWNILSDSSASLVMTSHVAGI